MIAIMASRELGSGGTEVVRAAWAGRILFCVLARW